MKMPLRITCITVFILAGMTVLPAQKTSFDFDHITIEDGLSQSSVYSVLQDDEGFIWIGTQDGLNKYDGKSFQTFFKGNKVDSTSLSDSWINWLVQDQRGFIWIATSGGGLNRYDPEKQTFKHFVHDPNNPNSISSDRVITCFIDSDNTLWVGTDRGLNRLNREDGTFTRFCHDETDPHSLSHDEVSAIYEDHRGQLWVGTAQGGLNRFDRDQRSFTCFQHDPNDKTSLSSNNVSAINEDVRGNLWVGTIKGLNRFNRKNETFRRYTHDPHDANSLSHNNVKYILSDKKARFWIATYGGGLNIYDFEEDGFYHYRHNAFDKNSLGDDFIWFMHEDRAGNLWLGTNEGVDKSKERRFIHHKVNPADENSLSNNFVWAITEDRYGYLWIGTNDGLNRYNPQNKRWKHFRQNPDNPHSLSNDKVLSVLESPSGNLWVGTRDGGLNYYNRKTGLFRRYRHDPENSNSISDNNVYCLFRDSKGNLWAGTDRGLNRYNPENGRFKRYMYRSEDSTSLSHNRVRTIFEDSRGRLWVGTYGGGLNLLHRKTGQFTSYQYHPDNANSISSNRVRAIYEQKPGIFWIGTSNGLNKFIEREGVFINYTVKDGLPNNVIYGILADKLGHLWLSTNKGLCEFNPAQNTFNNYDINDGLQSYEFNGGAYCKGRDGFFYFGGINGFNKFKPEEVQSRLYVPPVYITSVKVFGQALQTDRAVSQLDAIELSYKQNYITFEFAALDYLNPSKNQYKYRLKGFDKQWIDAGNRNTAYYTNLSGGEYTFEVQGSNSDGIFSNRTARIHLTIIPPFWERWWFRIGMAVIVILLAFTVYRVRINRIKRQREILQKRVEERTIELKERNHQLDREKKRVQRRALQASLLNEVGKQISSELKLETLLNEVVRLTTGSFNYYNVMILLMDRSGEGLKLQSIAGGFKDLFPDDLYVPLEVGMIGQAASTGEIQMSNNVDENPHFYRGYNEITRSELCVPIISAKETIAVLDIQSDQYDVFDDEDISTMQTFSTQIASAIKNARLYEQAQKEIQVRQKVENALRTSHNELAAAKKETDNIMENVEEGLFLLNSDLEINAQYSRSLETILDAKDIANKKLTKILENRVPSKLLESFREYLELMFDGSIDDSVVADLNPLSDVEVNVVDNAGIWYASKYLSFNFKRIRNESGHIPQLIVTVNDISNQKRLALQLREAEEDSKRQMEWLMSILHIEASLLQEFLTSVGEELNNIDDVLRANHSEADYASILTEVYRSMHMIKGNASLLDLKIFAEKAHEFENTITELQEKPGINGEDFVPLVLKLSDIRKMYNELNGLIERIRNIQTQFNPQKQSPNEDAFIRSLDNLVKRVSKDLQKEVSFDHSKFNVHDIPYRFRLAFKEVLVQLIRNTVYHGIEKKEERTQKGKPAAGRIELHSKNQNKHLAIYLKDDGRGLQLDQLRQKAIKSGYWSAEEVNSWDEKTASELIFHPSISTAAEAGLHAGRGVGLDAIRKKIEQYNGSIEVDFKPDQYCKFRIDLPLQKNAGAQKSGKNKEGSLVHA